MKKDIIFSIIVPTYNRAHLIKKLIDSFLSQTYPHFELIIVDDGSSDNTGEVVAAIEDKRIKYFWKENGERGAARNYGAARATGDYVNFFDSDDVAYPHHLETANKAIEELQHPDVFHLGMEIRTEDGAIEKQMCNYGPDGLKTLLSHCYVNPNPVFIKYDAWKSVQFVEDRSLAGSEDWVFFLQLTRFYNWIAFDRVITSYMVQHKGRSMSIATGDNCYLRAGCIRKILLNDPLFVKKYSKQQLNLIFAEPVSLASLHYALEKKKWRSISTLLETCTLSIKKIFSRRTLAIFKYLLIKW